MPFKGFRHTLESKLKMSLAHRGKKLTEQHKRRMSIALTGKRHSEETKKKIGSYHIGSRNFNWKGGVTLRPDYFVKYHRKWNRQKGKHYMQMQNFRRRSLLRKNGNINILTIQRVYANNIKKYGSLTCYLCLKKIEFGKDSIDHKTPLFRGGNNSFKNLAVACGSCNKSKRIKTEPEYRDWLSKVVGKYRR